MGERKNSNNGLAYLSAAERARPYKAWRNAIVILVTMIIASVLEMLSGRLTWFDGSPVSEFPPSISVLENPQNLAISLLCLLLVAAPPLVLVGSAMIVLFRERPIRTVISADGRFNWRLLLVGMSGIVLSVPFTAFAAVMSGESLSELATGIRHIPIANVVAFLMAICMSAAMEEVVFRGYLRQSLYEAAMRFQGRTGRSERMFSSIASSVLSALLFSLWHPDSPFLDRFVTLMTMGLLFSVLADRTGGIEVGMAAHAVYDLPLFLKAMVMPQAGRIDPQATVAIALVQMATDAAMVLLGIWLANATCGDAIRGRCATECPADADATSRQSEDADAVRRCHRHRTIMVVGLSLVVALEASARALPVTTTYHASAGDNATESMPDISGLYLTGPISASTKTYSVGDCVIIDRFDDDLMFVSSECGTVLAVPGDVVPMRGTTLRDDEYLVGYGEGGDGAFENEVVARGNLILDEDEGAGGGDVVWGISDRAILRLFPDFAFLG